MTVSVTPYILTFNTLAEDAGILTREHWGVETMHNGLDVSLDEDFSHVKSKNAPVNASLIRKLALSCFAIFDKMEQNGAELRGVNYTKTPIKVIQGINNYAPDGLRQILNAPFESPFSERDFRQIHIL